MMRKKIIFLSICMLIGGVVIVSVIILPPSERYDLSTPDVWGYGTITASEIRFPNSLNCALLPDNVEEGLEWRGLEIGVTSYKEMLKLLGDDIAVSWDTSYGYLVIRNLNPTGVYRDPDYWKILKVCFMNEKLGALNVGISGLPQSYSDIVSTYGEPDFMFFGNTYYDKVFIWPEKGLYIVFNEDWGEASIYTFYSPISISEFQDSWLANVLPDEQAPPPYE